MSELVILDYEDFEGEDYETDFSDWIQPKKSEEDEIQGKWPEWPMITRKDVP